MSKNMKIVLIVLGCVVLLCSGAVGIGLYWFSTSGKQMMEQMSQGVQRSAEEGEAFGVGKEDTACVKEALRRLQQNDSLPQAMAANMFLGSCLSKSQRTPTLCQDTPPSGEFSKISQWSLRKCKELGSASAACPQLMGMVQSHCEEQPTTPTAPAK